MTNAGVFLTMRRSVTLAATVGLLAALVSPARGEDCAALDLATASTGECILQSVMCASG